MRPRIPGPRRWVGYGGVALLLIQASAGPSTGALAADSRDRAAVIQLYQDVYRASENVPSGWNGSVPDCIPGTLSDPYKAAVLRRINYYRAMVGLPGDIVLDEVRSAKCQEAAVTMSAQDQLSHTLTSDWPCYTAAGAEAARRSNLSLGRIGAEAVDAYIDDAGAVNEAVGHRRWILFPPLQFVGIGSVPATGNFAFPAVDVLWVIEPAGARPTEPEFVAWPPPGYVPYPVLPRESGRWSFSIPSANFSGATVRMTAAGAEIGVVMEPVRSGYGDNTLVWRPQLSKGPQIGTVYEVAVAGVLTKGEIKTFSYAVEVIDPIEVRLVARVSGNEVLLSWPATTPPYLLEQTLAGSGGTWQSVSAVPSVVAGTATVRLPVQPGQRFFRLRKS